MHTKFVSVFVLISSIYLSRSNLHNSPINFVSWKADLCEPHQCLSSGLELANRIGAAKKGELVGMASSQLHPSLDGLCKGRLHTASL